MLRVAPVWMSGYAAVIILVTVLVNLATQLARTAYGLTLPSMRDSLGLSHFQEGSLITAVAVSLMVASLVFGMLAARYGTRFIAGALTIAAGVAMVLLGTSTNFLFALAMSAMIGFATGGCLTPVMGLLPIWFDSRNRGTVAGLAASGGGVSFLIIGALVPWLTGLDAEDGWRHAWYVLAAIVMLIGIFALIFLRDRPGQAAGAPTSKGAWPIAAYKSRLVWHVTFLAFCAGWCFGLYTTFFGVYEVDPISWTE